MSKEKKLTAHKEARLQIAERLQISLPGLIELLGQDEFDKRVKKAAKVLAEGIKVPQRKKDKSTGRVKITSQAA